MRDTLETLVQAGKIRAYGWSTDSPERAAVFAEGQNCVAIQHQMNVLDDNPALIALCEEFNLASINRGPLAMGLLTGKFSAGATLPIMMCAVDTALNGCAISRMANPTPSG